MCGIVQTRRTMHTEQGITCNSFIRLINRRLEIKYTRQMTFHRRRVKNLYRLKIDIFGNNAIIHQIVKNNTYKTYQQNCLYSIFLNATKLHT